MAEVRLQIENPNEPRHYARVKPVDRTVEALRGGRVLARSRRALRLLEHGRDLYDPVFYIPREDLKADFRERSESTHCPLKGDAQYFDLLDPSGGVEVEKIAWAYPAPIKSAEILADLIAFDADKVTFREGDA